MKPIEDFDLDALLARHEANYVIDADDGVEAVEEGDWIADRKYENRTDVYRHIPTGRFFAIDQSRSGSYWSDYEYHDPSIYEVFPHLVTRTVYLPTVEVPA